MAILKEYYSANARYLSDEAIRDIKDLYSTIPNSINVMAKKYHIGYKCAKAYMENCERKQYSCSISAASDDSCSEPSLNNQMKKKLPLKPAILQGTEDV